MWSFLELKQENREYRQKPRIDKSYIMKNAWRLYRCGFAKDFSSALRTSWAYAKREMRESERVQIATILRDATKEEATKRADHRKETFSDSFHAGAAAYYANVSRGTYFGD